MRIETAAQVKQTLHDHRAERARGAEGLTALQLQIAESSQNAFPDVECMIRVFDVWPGTGTPYPHPLNGRPDATAMVTGFLATPQQRRGGWK